MMMTQIICAFLTLWSGYVSARASGPFRRSASTYAQNSQDRVSAPNRRANSRLRVIGRLASPLAMLLFVRLIADFNGWFLLVWLLGLALFAIGVFRAARSWPDEPWRSHDSRTHSSEVRSLSLSGVCVLGIVAALIVPGLVLS